MRSWTALYRHIGQIEDGHSSCHCCQLNAAMTLSMDWVTVIISPVISLTTLRSLAQPPDAFRIH